MSAPQPSPVRWLPALVELFTSLVALSAVGALFLNKLETELAFFGETPETLPEHVTTYQRWLVVLVVALVGGVVAAVRRRGRAARSLYWHGVLVAVAAFAAIAFHVTTAPPVEPRPVEDGPGGNHACFSGGDSDECVGG